MDAKLSPRLTVIWCLCIALYADLIAAAQSSKPVTDPVSTLAAILNGTGRKIRVRFRSISHPERVNTSTMDIGAGMRLIELPIECRFPDYDSIPGETIKSGVWVIANEPSGYMRLVRLEIPKSATTDRQAEFLDLETNVNSLEKELEASRSKLQAQEKAKVESLRREKEALQRLASTQAQYNQSRGHLSDLKESTGLLVEFSGNVSDRLRLAIWTAPITTVHIEPLQFSKESAKAPVCLIMDSCSAVYLANGKYRITLDRPDIEGTGFWALPLDTPPQGTIRSDTTERLSVVVELNEDREIPLVWVCDNGRTAADRIRESFRTTHTRFDQQSIADATNRQDLSEYVEKQMLVNGAEPKSGGSTQDWGDWLARLGFVPVVFVSEGQDFRIDLQLVPDANVSGRYKLGTVPWPPNELMSSKAVGNP